MPIINRLIDLLLNLTTQQMALGLMACSALLLLIEDRRLALLALLAQYSLLALLVGLRVYTSIILVRAGLGLAVCLILLVTAVHAQAALAATPPAARNQRVSPRRRRQLSVGSSSLFRLAITAFAGLIAYGLWRTYPLPSISSEICLTSYWLMTVGLLLSVTGLEPLRIGYGLVTFLNGFEALYLVLERGLSVIGLLGIIDILIALAIAVCAETWLASMNRETTRC